MNSECPVCYFLVIFVLYSFLNSRRRFEKLVAIHANALQHEIAERVQIIN